MSNEDTSHERRITRLEHIVMGTDDQPERGMASRLMMTEAGFSKMEAKWNRIEMLIILGIVGAILNLVLSASRTGGSAGSHQSTSVITSDASRMADSSDSPMTYLTTEEMAKKAGVSPRTILSWIAAPTERFKPMPIETSKGWVFDAECRILPPNAADGGIATLSSAGEVKP